MTFTEGVIVPEIEPELSLMWKVFNQEEKNDQTVRRSVLDCMRKCNRGLYEAPFISINHSENIIKGSMRMPTNQKKDVQGPACVDLGCKIRIKGTFLVCV